MPYEFTRNDALQARNFFDRNPSFVDSKGNVKPPPQLNRNEFGGIIGGPIIRSRTELSLQPAGCCADGTTYE